MSDCSIADNPPRIHLRTWLLATGEPLRDLARIDRGFSQPATAPPQRTVQLITPSAALRDLLTRCLRTLDLVVMDAGEPDLLVLDLAAPDALTHCRALRERDSDLPIVALTPLVTDHPLAWEAGANAVLPIPFDVLDLQATITILLGEDDA